MLHPFEFGLGRTEQTERILRAMDNPYFTILGHATGRQLLRRPCYDIDIPRVIEHAKKTGCFFEINSSPVRLDLSATNARLANQAGVRIAISTDAHSLRELDLIRWGMDQGRRAGLGEKLRAELHAVAAASSRVKTVEPEWLRKENRLPWSKARVRPGRRVLRSRGAPLTKCGPLGFRRELRTRCARLTSRT